MFGYDDYGRVRSFDVTITAEEATFGQGYYVQRSGEPSVSGTSFAIPGYFIGLANARYQLSRLRSLRVSRHM